MAIVQSQPVDLIISDVHLENGGSVFDFLSWIRKNRSTINTPFVLFSLEPTAMAQVVEHGVRIAARSLGAARYITMDTFDGRALLHEIEWLIPEVKVGSYYIGHDLDGQKISK
jgi:CheY-like chemotaxis protein